MKLTDEAKAFHHIVYETVSKIPKGKVTSYAYMIGCPQNSRRVGSSLKHSNYIIDQLSQDDTDLPYTYDTLPWFRVVSSAGRISRRDNSSNEVRQVRLLEEEGVSVSASHSIDLDRFGWFPDDVDD